MSLVGINAIPKDILIKIFSYLDDEKRCAHQLGRLSLVSKQFKSISEANSLWKPVAEKHAIHIELGKTAPIKEQIKFSITKANELWQRFNLKSPPKDRSELSTVIACRSLDTYPFQILWEKNLSTKTVAESKFLLQKIDLSNSDILMIIYQIASSLEKNVSNFSLNVTILINVIEHIVNSKKFHLVKDIIHVLLCCKVAGKIAEFLNFSLEENPLILCDETTIEQLWNIMPDLSADSNQFRPKLYEKIAKAGSLFDFLEQLQNDSSIASISTTSSKIFPLLRLQIARHLMYTSCEWPNPETILSLTLNRITNSAERDATEVILKPLFIRYVKEYEKLQEEARVKAFEKISIC